MALWSAAGWGLLFTEMRKSEGSTSQESSGKDQCWMHKLGNLDLGVWVMLKSTIPR